MNIAVSKEIVDALATTAERLGMTQYALANQLLGVGLELVGQGYNASQIRDIALFYRVMTELETVPVPGRLLDRMIVEMYRTNPEAVGKAWCEAGRMLASYIKAFFGGLEGAAALVPYIVKAVPAKRFEVKVGQRLQPQRSRRRLQHGERRGDRERRQVHARRARLRGQGGRDGARRVEGPRR